MGGRVEYAIYAAGLRKGDLARILDVARQTVTRWVGGDDIPEEKLDRIALVTGRSKSWLRYGLEAGATADRYAEGFSTARRLASELADELRDQLRKLEPPGK